MRPEDLNGAFLAQLGEAGAQLLALHRVSQLDDLEELGRKEGQPGELQLLAFGQRVAQLKHTMVGQTDDVARPGVLHQLAALRQEGHHVGGAELLATAHHLQLHAALEATGRDAQEGDAVAVGRIHVGLDLEHHARELLFRWIDRALQGRPGPRRRRQIHQGVQHLTHAEVVDGRTEEHRRLLAGQEGVPVEGLGGTTDQLDLALGLLVVHAEALAGLVIVQAGQDLVVLGAGTVLPGAEDAHLFLLQVDDAAEVLAHAHRPGEGRSGHAQRALDLVKDLQRLAHLAVHLVDEGDDGRIACPAHLQQAQRLRLDAVGGIDDHQGGIHGRQHPIGVFREVLVARGVQQVDDAVAVLHLHNRAGHRDAALLLDLHPVGRGMARRLARLDAARDLDGSCVEQQLLGEGGLARVGVGDDGKGAAAAHLVLLCGHGGGFYRQTGLLPQFPMGPWKQAGDLPGRVRPCRRTCPRIRILCRHRWHTLPSCA